MRQPRLYSYIVDYDGGSAPNPFHSFCTLAICKPAIRRTARKYDYVVGLGGKNRCDGWPIIYAMKLTEPPMPLDEYWHDPRFRDKRPNMKARGVLRVGDNIYHRDSRGDWIQENSVHDLSDKKKDLRGKNVLISDDFIYWGSQRPPSPEFHADLLMGLGDKPMTQGHRCNFREGVVDKFIEWFKEQRAMGRRRRGMPFDWEEDAGTSLCVPRHRSRKRC